MCEHVVSPALFDSVDEYAEQLVSGTAFSDNVVPETSPVISFTENAFAQFFENEVNSEITGFDFKYKQRAARLRYSRKDLSKQARALIALFEQFCDIHDDVLGAGYGGQASVLEEFHSTTRGWAVTVWLALLGVGIQQNSPALAVLASFVLVPFSLLDAYYSWLYSQALRHARGLERLSADYYRAIESGEDDEELRLDFEAALAAHRLGLYSHFRRFSLPELRSARPRLVFQWFYPGLVCVGIAAALLIALLG